MKKFYKYEYLLWDKKFKSPIGYIELTHDPRHPSKGIVMYDYETDLTKVFKDVNGLNYYMTAYQYSTPTQRCNSSRQVLNCRECYHYKNCPLMKITKKLGNIEMRHKREAMGLTQKELSKKAHVSLSTIKHIEEDIINLESNFSCEKLAKFLNMPIKNFYRDIEVVEEYYEI